MGINYPIDARAWHLQLVLDKRPAMRQRRLPEASSSATACYVCHEPTTERCWCACRAVVHAGCLLQSVHATGQARCTICREPIANLRLRKRSRRYICMSVLLVLSGVATVACSVLSGLAVGWATETGVWSDGGVQLSHGAGWIVASMWTSKGFMRLLNERDLAMQHTEYEYHPK